MKQRPDHFTRLFLCICCLPLLFNFSCGDSVTRPQIVTPQELLPLQIGNYWIYERRIKITREPEQMVIDTAIIDTMIVWEDEEWFGYRGSDSTFYRCDTLGLWWLDLRRWFGRYKHLILMYPSKVGDYWYLHDITQDSSKYEIFSTSITVSTPAGTINDCIYYGHHWDSDLKYPYSSYSWFKPGLGVVKSKSRRESIPGIYQDSSRELIGCNIQ